jgi:hypothetical protein
MLYLAVVPIRVGDTPSQTTRIIRKNTRRWISSERVCVLNNLNWATESAL